MHSRSLLEPSVENPFFVRRELNAASRREATSLGVALGP